ncbi:MAG: hypothetical protein IPJ81_02840 [Chitinophagaceae bacterium]|nr:hypothetical protein [Chitinophagaceae bacterium]
MKQLVLKPLQLFIVTILILLGANCNKQPLVAENDSVANETASLSKFTGPTDITAVNPFNKRVGAPVDGRTGDRWIASYKKNTGTVKPIRLITAFCNLLSSNLIV